MNSIFWYILGIILIVSEIFIPGLVVIFFGISAILIGLLTSFGILTQISYQFIGWGICSIILVLLLRKFFKSFFPSLEIKQKVKDTLVGKSGVVIEEINPLQGTGRIEAEGTNWKAISLNGETILVGKKVIIEKQQDLTLYVKEKID